MEMDDGMDLLQGVQQGAEGSVPMPDGGDFEMPSLEKMMEILEHMDMPEEEKQQLKEALVNKGDMLGNLAKMGVGGSMANSPVGNISQSTQFIVFFVAIAIVTLVIVFFGYKLYRSLTEKERKREEKKKQKQQKKKK